MASFAQRSVTHIHHRQQGKMGKRSSCELREPGIWCTLMCPDRRWGKTWALWWRNVKNYRGEKNLAVQIWKICRATGQVVPVLRLVHFRHFSNNLSASQNALAIPNNNENTDGGGLFAYGSIVCISCVYHVGYDDHHFGERSKIRSGYQIKW